MQPASRAKKFKKITPINRMERYMLHLKNEGFSPKDSRRVVYRARALGRRTGASVRVARIATDFIELDVSVEADLLDQLVGDLGPIGPIDNIRHVFEEEIPKEQGIRDGIFYFNNERFWESHEAFEGVWKKCLGREKELVQGIILVAVAFAHGQRNERRVGIGMLKRALDKLGKSPSMYHTIDVNKMRKNAVDMRMQKQLVLFDI